MEIITDFLKSLHGYNIVLILTMGFALGSILGYISWRLKLSPIIGYLFAGFMIGPFSPGFVADLRVSEQLAEIGVILMMFGVGLHFKFRDLYRVKKIAIPGALGQTLFATLCSAIAVHYFGWSILAGVILGLSIGVASTVVLVRMLTDAHLLHTQEGHISVGWLIVEDLITVFILILLPDLATIASDLTITWGELLQSVLWVIFKFAFLTVLMMTLGQKFVTFALNKVLRTHSHELFTLALLALTFVIATGSAVVFGISIALGAFISGMVIGQTGLRDLAMINSLPMKDAFIAIFFISVGMLFNPQAIIDHFWLFLTILGIILLMKPLAAFLIAIVMKYPVRTGVIVAAALAQIGEFSFILSEEAMKHKLLSEEAFDIIVACAIVSITINSLIFKIFRPKKDAKHAGVLHQAE